MFNRRDLEKEGKQLKGQLDELISLRTRFMDVQRGIAAGTIATGSPKAMLNNLQVLNMYKENLETKKKIARITGEIEGEISSAQSAIARLENQLQQPLGLELLSPVGGEDWQMGGVEDIRWRASGPVGDKINIELYKDGRFFRQIDLAPETGVYKWAIPALPKKGAPVIPPGEYQIKIVDITMPNLFDISNEFKIK